MTLPSGALSADLHIAGSDFFARSLPFALRFPVTQQISWRCPFPSRRPLSPRTRSPFQLSTGRTCIYFCAGFLCCLLFLACSWNHPANNALASARAHCAVVPSCCETVLFTKVWGFFGKYHSLFVLLSVDGPFALFPPRASEKVIVASLGNLRFSTRHWPTVPLLFSI